MCFKCYYKSQKDRKTLKFIKYESHSKLMLMCYYRNKSIF